FEPDKFPIDLDDKVRSDTFPDADFEDSVITKFQETLCIYCKWKGPTLCIEHDCYSRLQLNEVQSAQCTNKQNESLFY
ncbi:MAG: hypothetical protein WA919_26880, partial [Coleofasciculaceae cyanobacterium]